MATEVARTRRLARYRQPTYGRGDTLRPSCVINAGQMWQITQRPSRALAPLHVSRVVLLTDRRLLRLTDGGNRHPKTCVSQPFAIH